MHLVYKIQGGYPFSEFMLLVKLDGKRVYGMIIIIKHTWGIKQVLNRVIHLLV